ncbi:MAG: hypothetical protein MUC33_01205 [Desulfobacterales bacterium]|jgi:hypothetical protein|nr:hypothetical protein [Desulfobacterales bacterium]MCU0601260.1 hypothetical protein [Desulfobacterales bacterium]
MKEKKYDLKKLIDEFRGKGKVTIKAMKKEENGRWSVAFMEGNNTEIVHFNTHSDAQEFCFAFGGKNHLTVSAPSEMLLLSGWSQKILSDLGHRIISITIERTYAATNTEKKIEHIFPTGCGSMALPGSIKKNPGQQKCGIKLIERFGQRSLIERRKIEFADNDSLDLFIDQCKKMLPEYEIQIRGAITQNVEYKALLGWKRKKVGDGSKRMQLRLDLINGESFQNFMYQDILKYADGMASSECQRIYIKRRSEVVEDRCGFSIA